MIILLLFVSLSYSFKLSFKKDDQLDCPPEAPYDAEYETCVCLDETKYYVPPGIYDGYEGCLSYDEICEMMYGPNYVFNEKSQEKCVYVAPSSKDPTSSSSSSKNIDAMSEECVSKYGVHSYYDSDYEECTCVQHYEIYEEKCKHMSETCPLMCLDSYYDPFTEACECNNPEHVMMWFEDIQVARCVSLDDYCEIQIPNTHWDNFKEDCVCDEYYESKNNSDYLTCVSFDDICESDIPHSHYDKLKDECVCDENYETTMDKNNKVKCVNYDEICQSETQNSHYDSSKQECVCDNNYESKYINNKLTCLSHDEVCKTNIQNSHYDSSKQECVCDNGYKAIYENSQLKCYDQTMLNNRCKEKHGEHSFVVDENCDCETGYIMSEDEICMNGDDYCEQIYSNETYYKLDLQDCDCKDPSKFIMFNEKTNKYTCVDYNGMCDIQVPNSEWKDDECMCKEGYEGEYETDIKGKELIKCVEIDGSIMSSLLIMAFVLIVLF